MTDKQTIQVKHPTEIFENVEIADLAIAILNKVPRLKEEDIKMIGISGQLSYVCTPKTICSRAEYLNRINKKEDYEQRLATGERILETLAENGYIKKIERRNGNFYVIERQNGR